MDANQRVINRLERLYSLYGAGDFVDSVVSIGGHAYRQDIRQAAYRFINTHLKDDPRVVSDSEVDLVMGSGSNRKHPISPERLRVFPEDSDIPKDEMNTTIDRHFVPLVQVELPKKGEYEVWKASILAELHRVAFRYFPERIPPARRLRHDERQGIWLESESGIEVCLRRATEIKSAKKTQRIVMIVRNPDISESFSDLVDTVCEPTDSVYVCAPRGVEETRWTRKNPPNYVERSHVLLGRTVDTGRVWDVVAAARYLRDEHDEDIPIYVCGEGPAAVLAAYAALWEMGIAGVIAVNPPLSHMDARAPQFLNVLRICDIPDVFGMLAPRALAIHGCGGDVLRKVAQIYSSAGASSRLTCKLE